MTTEELIGLFEKHDGIYLQKPEGSRRIDLDAFNLLDRLCPRTHDMISASEHDEYWISISLEELAIAATEDDVIFLIQCGARVYDSFDGLSFFS